MTTCFFFPNLNFTTMPCVWTYFFKINIYTKLLNWNEPFQAVLRVFGLGL